jgi:hypothetical protein
VKDGVKESKKIEAKDLNFHLMVMDDSKKGMESEYGGVKRDSEYRKPVMRALLLPLSFESWDH